MRFPTELIFCEIESESPREATGGAKSSAAVGRGCIERAVTHDHHDLVITSLHTHLDHDHCLETVVLRGAVNAVTICAEQLVALGTIIFPRPFIRYERPVIPS